MLGKDQFKVESKADLSKKRYEALILFYDHLIGNDALCLYEFLVLKGSSASFEELNRLLNSLNISIDSFEKSIARLNQYKLVKTLKKNDEDRYIFVLYSPMTMEEFVKDDLFVRDFILKTSGLYYQSLISELRFESRHEGYEDVSARYDVSSLSGWTRDDESYLKPKEEETYSFNTMFDINVFLKDISGTMFPLKYRTYENLSEIAKLADLYNISYDRMRTFIPQVSKSDSSTFDLNLLRYLCQNAVPEYKEIKGDSYDVPCLLFLMNRQQGKEVTPFDKKLIYRLANDYRLNPAVINVLLEHALRNCDNRLLENYIYPIASDLHRNDITTSAQALDRLDRYEGRAKARAEEEKETYDNSGNPLYDEERRQALLNRRRQNDQ
ncbi:MAG: DnaD domain protein [Erysipelotrichaceae bacterium]|nr:DnaD domain protein [Erysipelotrichaceae bacterium]